MTREEQILYVSHNGVGFRERRKPMLPYRLLFNARLQAIAQFQVFRRACRMRNGYVALFRD